MSFSCDECGRTLPNHIEERNSICSDCATTNSYETDDGHPDSQATEETELIYRVEAIITDVSRGEYLDICNAQCLELDYEKLEFHHRLYHTSKDIKCIPGKRFELKNVELVYKNNETYLRSNVDTEVREILHLEPIDQIIGPVVEAIDTELSFNTQCEKRYYISGSDGEQLELRLYQKHGVDTTQFSGLCKIRNLRKSETDSKTYLESTQDTLVQCPPDSEVELDILIVGDTHIGYRNFSPDVRDYSKDVCRNSFESLIQRALQEDIDGIVHTGDIFESNDPANDDIGWLSNQLKKLQINDIAFIFIRGNHDPIDQPKQLATLENFVHVSDSSEYKNSGFSITGHDCDQVSHPREIKNKRFNQELVFIHPKRLDCGSVQRTNISEIEVSDSFIFCGHCHTPGKASEPVGDTPLIFTGSPGGLGTGETSIFRAKVWKGEVAIVENNICTRRVSGD